MSELDLFQSAGGGMDASHFGLAEDGRAYVIAGPFTKAMGYSAPSAAIRSLDEDEKGVQILHTPGGDQRVSVIFEDGIWELIFRSTLPSAKSVKARVKAILRQLRETGVVDTREKPLTEIEVARRYVAALERIEVLEPAARSWELLAEASGDYSVREAAQILDRDPAISTGQRRLFASLKAAGWLAAGGLPYQRHIDAGRLVLKAGSYDNRASGETHLTRQVRVTAKGLHDLHRLLGGSGPLLLSTSNGSAA